MRGGKNLKKKAKKHENIIKARVLNLLDEKGRIMRVDISTGEILSYQGRF